MKRIVYILAIGILSSALYGQGAKNVRYCKEDPKTHIAYKKPVRIDSPANYKIIPEIVEGGDAKTPGRRWRFEWKAPGPVYKIDFVKNSRAPYAQLDYCTNDENAAVCTGWTNSQKTGFFDITVYWEQPCLD